VSIKLVIDMNLSPDWESVLKSNGWPAVHWSNVGDVRAIDRAIMDWAKSNGYVVFTHDLDFGTMLALTHESGPSVVQVRAQTCCPITLDQLWLPRCGKVKRRLRRARWS
jgi:predicted nuclease of predicted toxin-antitoxin system